MPVRFILTALAALLPRRLTAMAWLLCMGTFGAGMAQAATSNFNGGAVSGCTLQANVYSCASLTLSNEYDIVNIASGYTVNVSSNVQFRYNQKLSMTGSARLSATGNLHIGDIAPTNISITGGSLEAGGKFTVGNQNQAITANITAGSMQLGSGSQLSITGTIRSSGAVNIASHVTITGPISGTDITTNSPVVLKGDITGTGKFILASGSTVTGTITARDADLLPANSLVTGEITVTNQLTLGSATTVRGDVEASTIILYSSEAIVHGNATVDRIYLYWHGRIADYIRCRSAATIGDCSCVDNQSGYAYNTLPGPKCAPAQPVATLHHFRVEHDGQASACAPETVTVTACANATCSAPHYGDGASIQMLPGGATIQLGPNPTPVTVERSTPGVATLQLIHAGASVTPECRNSATNSSSCAMNFTGGVVLSVAAPHYRAGNFQDVSIRATEPDSTTKTCVAAFQNTNRPLAYSCAYDQPTSGKPLSLRPSETSPSSALTCTAGTTATINTRFDGDGRATVQMSYPDAGKLSLSAGVDTIKGSASFIVAPDHFVLKDYPTSPSKNRAGEHFNLKLEAVNKQGAVTTNFHANVFAQVNQTQLAAASAGSGILGSASLTNTPDFVQGSASVTARYSEVGKFDLKATLPDFLGSGLDVVGSAQVGDFIPHHYTLELNQPKAFYYARQPVPVVVTARNAQEGVTQNYDSALGLSDAVTLAAFNRAGAQANPANGKLDDAVIAAANFQKGQANAAPRYSPTDGKPMVPVEVRLRASNGKAVAAEVVRSDAGAQADAYEQAIPLIRTGRLQIGNRFGRVGAVLDLDVRAEYWSSSGSWVLNHDDSDTEISANALALSAYATTAGANPPALPTFTPAFKLSQGKSKISLSSQFSGWIDVAFNLGAISAANQSCLTEKKVTPGATLPWLRSLSGCIDPSGRATFGIFAPENRRVIHMREVFH